MAKLSELKKRTEKTIRKTLDNETFLLYTNEALEQLSDVANYEANPLIIPLDSKDYMYKIFDNGLHKVFEDYRVGDVESYYVYTEDGATIDKDWEEDDVVSQYTLGDYEVLTLGKFFDTRNLIDNPNLFNSDNWIVRDDTNVSLSISGREAVVSAVNSVQEIEIYNPLQIPVTSGDEYFYKFRFKTPNDEATYTGVSFDLIVDYGADVNGDSPGNTQVIPIDLGRDVVLEADTWYYIYGTFEAEYTNALMNIGIKESSEAIATNEWEFTLDGLYGIYLVKITDTEYELFSAVDLDLESDEQTIRTILRSTETTQQAYSEGEITNQNDIKLKVDAITLEQYVNEVDAISATEEDANVEAVVYIANKRIKLPNNFEKVVKVEIEYQNERYLLEERGQIDEEIISNDYNPNSRSQAYRYNEHYYFLSNNDTVLNVKSDLIKNDVTVHLYYYKTLPLYDVDADAENIDDLVIPINKKYYNLINFYAIHKYNESWKDADTSDRYLQKFYALRQEYALFIQEKTERDEGIPKRATKWGL